MSSQAMERDFRWAFEHVVAGIGVVDLAGLFVDANPAFGAMLDIEPTALLGRHLDEFIVTADGAGVARNIPAILSGTSEAMGTEAFVARPDGTTAWMLVTLKGVLDPTNTPGYLFVHLQDITTQRRAEEQAHRLLEDMRHLLGDVVVAVARAAELRDPYTAGHQLRVAAAAAAIANDLGFSADRAEGVRVGAAIHDVGKLAVPAEILTRPSQLTRPEFELVKAHPQAGHDIVADIRFPWPVARVILEHHERLDGSGYPNGLPGRDILAESQVIGVADVFEAVSAHRPYRPGLGVERAVEVLNDGAGSLFDADIVAACIRCGPAALSVSEMSSDDIISAHGLGRVNDPPARGASSHEERRRPIGQGGDTGGPRTA